MKKVPLLLLTLVLAYGAAHGGEPSRAVLFVNGANERLLNDLDSARRGLFSDRPELSAISDKAAEFLRTLPAGTAREAVTNVLVFLNSTLRYAPDQPVTRGPHEWSSRQVLAYGTFNGCVEAERAFFRLFKEAYPGFKARAIGSFDSSDQQGGHALVEVEDADGTLFLVDTSAFGKLPRSLLKRTAHKDLTDRDLANPIDFAPERRGVIVQLPEDSDLFVERAGSGYRVTGYPYARVFEGDPLIEEKFTSLKSLNAYLAAYGRADISFKALRELGIVLDYADPGRMSFLLGREKKRYIVFSCDSSISEDGDSAALEAKARRQYAATGKASTCERN